MFSHFSTYAYSARILLLTLSSMQTSLAQAQECVVGMVCSIHVKSLLAVNSPIRMVLVIASIPQLLTRYQNKPFEYQYYTHPTPQHISTPRMTFRRVCKCRSLMKDIGNSARAKSHAASMTTPSAYLFDSWAWPLTSISIADLDDYFRILSVTGR